MKRQKTASIPVELPSLLFEDRFVVRTVDNTKFENVGRIRGKSSGFDAEIILDMNIDIYPIAEKENLTIGLSTRVTGTTSGQESVHQLIDCGDSRPKTLMDAYDYVMYGKIFQLEERTSDRRTIHASFGGLLMSLTADKQVVGELELDMRVYLLVRKKQDY